MIACPWNQTTPDDNLTKTSTKTCAREQNVLTLMSPAVESDTDGDAIGTRRRTTANTWKQS
eukprot:11167155-Lingulodinium_polyedra.AAC.1